MWGRSYILFSTFPWFWSKYTQNHIKQRLNFVGCGYIQLAKRKIISSSLLGTYACVYPLSVSHLHFPHQVFIIDVQTEWVRGVQDQSLAHEPIQVTTAFSLPSPPGSPLLNSVTAQWWVTSKLLSRYWRVIVHGDCPRLCFCEQTYYLCV